MSRYRYKASIRICLDPDISRAVLESLQAEVRQPAQPAKGRVGASMEGRCVVLEIASDSLSGLRALVNSYLYLVHAAFSVLEAVEGLQA
ncbi:MAG: KEOPS complex subunit Pcc1 [Desulfurococcales archaeon]|nr:KEOPS complex subunit Pcc1 [Desulfurococcales archaeon]